MLPLVDKKYRKDTKSRHILIDKRGSCLHRTKIGSLIRHVRLFSPSGIIWYLVLFSRFLNDHITTHGFHIHYNFTPAHTYVLRAARGEGGIGPLYPQLCSPNICTIVFYVYIGMCLCILVRPRSDVCWILCSALMVTELPWLMLDVYRMTPLFSDWLGEKWKHNYCGFINEVKVNIDAACKKKNRPSVSPKKCQPVYVTEI
jgi:hypothetical protein